MVHDLIGGRAAWTAQGLPTEGSVGDRDRIGHHVSAIATIPLDATVGDARADGDGRWPIPVTSPGGVLLGTVDPAALALPADTPVERLMVPAPSTIRPELRVSEVIARLRDDGLDHVFVTAVDGTLRGLIVTEELHV
jgi:hypothetical protein